MSLSHLIDHAIEAQAKAAGGQEAEIGATAHVVFERLVELGLPRSAEALANTHAAVANTYHELTKAVVVEAAKAGGLREKDFAPDMDFSPKLPAQRKALLGQVASAIVEAGALKIREHERSNRRARTDAARAINAANR